MIEAPPVLRLEKIVPAPPRVAFEAWLDPEALRRFMCPTPGTRVTRAECDPRVGGRFLIVMHIGGVDLPHHGEYLEIRRHSRLAFTWLSHVAGEGSRVTLGFSALPDGRTRLTLEHSGLPDAGIRAKHEGGWSAILAALAGLEPGPQPGA